MKFSLVLIFIMPCFYNVGFSSTYVKSPKVIHVQNIENIINKNSPKELLDRLSPKSLNRCGFIIYSQFGEDGIIKEIFRRLNIKSGFFVEFGAGDGITLSNSRYLWEQGWSGVMIEQNLTSFNEMKNNYLNVNNILFLHEFVTWKYNDPRGHSFDEIKDLYFSDKEIDFLSIDIDGADYYILKGLKCRPKVICIENNLNWHPLFKKEVPEEVAIKNLHQPLSVLIELAKEKGYEPICLTINLFLIRKDLYEPFKEIPSDPLTLYRDAFRALPEKNVLIHRRATLPIIRKLEGLEFEQLCPITEDF